MPRIFVTQLRPASPRLVGSAIGDEHAQQICALLAQADRKDDLAVIDFVGVESASASYLKRLFTPFFIESEASAGCPSNFFPVLVNLLAPDLLEDLEEFFGAKERVAVVAADKGSELCHVRLIGRLERAASETFVELRRQGEATAQRLFDLYPERTTNQTAWNNRLTYLVSLKIAKRRREGRVWVYQPTVKG